MGYQPLNRGSALDWHTTYSSKADFMRIFHSCRFIDHPSCRGVFFDNPEHLPLRWAEGAGPLLSREINSIGEGSTRWIRECDD
jgi:hypothetical protein